MIYGDHVTLKTAGMMQKYSFDLRNKGQFNTGLKRYESRYYYDFWRSRDAEDCRNDAETQL